MHTLHIDEQLSWRGGEQQAIWLIEGLISHGIRVTAIGKKGSAYIRTLKEMGSVQAYTLPLFGEFDLYSAFRIAQIVRDSAVDLIHAHTSHAHSLALLVKLLVPNIRVVVSRRVSFMPAPNCFSKWKYRNADVILPVSYYVSGVLRNAGLPEQKIRVVRSSINLRHIEQPPYTKKELGINEQTFLIFTAGALVPHKDHLTLIRAINDVLKEIPNILLWIAGEGPLRKDLEKEIENYNLYEHVHLLGHRTDVPRLIKTADVYISSSWSEGLGTSILEALACETPVIATEAGGVPEMVIPNETGILIPAHDPKRLSQAILEVYQNPQSARLLAKQGKKHVEQYFSVERMVTETIQVYKDLLSNKGHNR